ncbi:indolepyruvate oxidoreductase subunit beta [Sulfolobus sp. S-194]|uniref:indolepyruvate oxidoreductase subunit beta n=1 Tax=Sulfolobus sp. S-194 TaxID=2512240 RepID=UPI0014370D92|nr:indolepyruvate oxidoreductase subunit beta [Sulfolobus sp. S-194]QIW23590.1 indolepyruvate oxidoreductase subunit beta [Sulfolobus sp. S-194]
MEKLDILIAGVGGQGVITLGKIIATSALLSGVKALVAETHGLAQRGGAVNVHVRLGNVYSPLIKKADFLVALEATEALRNLSYTDKETILIVNERVERSVLPRVKMLSLDEIKERLKEYRAIYIPAERVAIDSGNPRGANIVMLSLLMEFGLKKLIDEDKLLSLLDEKNKRVYLAGKESITFLRIR